MAEQQGYTKLPNDVIEGLARLPLNGTQFRILLVVVRYTNGFQRESHALSETFLATATGIHKKQIQRELNELIRFNILTVEKAATFNTPRVIKLNMDTINDQIRSHLIPDANK
jgi:phage replication O-like protein O